MKILVACEESQAVTIELRRLGHEAYSCDIIPCSGGHPEWHIMQDVLPLLNGNCEFDTADGSHHQIYGKWGMIVAFPPCTYLTVTGNKWFKPEYASRFPTRQSDRNAAIEFFMAFANADCPRIAIENPVGIMSSTWRKPSQIVQPWMFGDAYEKKTCLWLKGLRPLAQTKVVAPPPRMKLKSGKTMPDWYARPRHSKERQTMRSKTFPGIARAMAEQWAGEMEATL